VGTLFGFGGRFDSLNALLEFFLKCLLKKCSSFGKEKYLHVIEGLAVGRVVGDEVAVVEKGIKAGVKEFTASREG